MLVLSRNKEQEIVISHTVDGVLTPLVVINVVDIRGDKVKIGITAPKELRVDRKEVFESILAEGFKRDGLKREQQQPSEEVEGDHESAD